MGTITPRVGCKVGCYGVLLCFATGSPSILKQVGAQALLDTAQLRGRMVNHRSEMQKGMDSHPTIGGFAVRGKTHQQIADGPSILHHICGSLDLIYGQLAESG